MNSIPLDFKKYFEANLLDGDPLTNVSLLNALEVYEVAAEYIARLEQRVLEAAGEDDEQVWDTEFGNCETCEFMPTDGSQDCICIYNNKIYAQLRTKLKGVFHERH